MIHPALTDLVGQILLQYHSQGLLSERCSRGLGQTWRNPVVSKSLANKEQDAVCTVLTVAVSVPASHQTLEGRYSDPRQDDHTRLQTHSQNWNSRSRTLAQYQYETHNTTWFTVLICTYLARVLRVFVTGLPGDWKKGHLALIISYKTQ